LLQILLRLGLYQMFWLDRIPEHAAVNETVELAKHLGCGPQAGFLNAVLRGFAREREATRNLLTELRAQDLPVGWSHPDWLVQRWIRRWGADSARRLLEWNNTPPDTFARVNTLRTDAGKLIAQWRAEGVDYDFYHTDWSGENLLFRLKAHPPLAGLPSLQAGGFYVQDPSTLLAVRELDPQPGETVLDLCAAPGGKTTFIAQLMQNQGRLVATDISRDRLALLRQNTTRLGATLVEPALLASEGGLELLPAGITTAPFAPVPDCFDRVLLDAPCSNTGVMRRRVELRWRVRPEELDRLCTKQSELLRLAACRVRPGGTLVYSTCSLESEENEQVVAAFLKSKPGFTLETERQLLPFAEAVDGAYVARLRRSPA
jgi:16S rRNA (cytosine967-C5)-methyltransferase